MTRTIYFATVILTEQVHAGALGFTNRLYRYVAGDEEAAARKLVKGAVERETGVRVLTIHLTVSSEQDPAKFHFPDSIIGLR